MPPVKKRLKHEVDYSRGMGDTRCWACVHFNAARSSASGTCDRVEGVIDPDYWCKLFKAKRK